MKLIFDSSVLSPFARARQLDLLERLTAPHERLIPRAVRQELENGVALEPSLAQLLECPWLTQVPVDSLDELLAFAACARRLVSGERNVGEASVLAWAQVHGGVALVDDQAAVQYARDTGIKVRRTLALIADGLKNGLLDETTVVEVVSRLRNPGGARLPCDGPGFLAWARSHGLL